MCFGPDEWHAWHSHTNLQSGELNVKIDQTKWWWEFIDIQNREKDGGGERKIKAFIRFWWITSAYLAMFGSIWKRHFRFHKKHMLG